MATGLYKAKHASRDTMHSSGLIPHRNPWCSYRAMPASSIPGGLVKTYRPLSRPHLCRVTISNTTQSGPQHFPLFCLLMVDTVVSPMKPAICFSCIRSLENNWYIHLKAQKTTMIRRHPIASMTQTHKFSLSNQVFGLSHCKLRCRVSKTLCSMSRLMSWSC